MEIFTAGWCDTTVDLCYYPLLGFMKDLHVLPMRLGDHHGCEWGHKTVLQGKLQSFTLHFLFLWSRYQQPVLENLECDIWNKLQQNIQGTHFYVFNVYVFQTALILLTKIFVIHFITNIFFHTKTKRKKCNAYRRLWLNRSKCLSTNKKLDKNQQWRKSIQMM